MFPEGVNYSELKVGLTIARRNKNSFRPQQGLLIMNNQNFLNGSNQKGFRPQQGLTIMNIA